MGAGASAVFHAVIAATANLDFTARALQEGEVEVSREKTPI
jgi:hypothetical protein